MSIAKIFFEYAQAFERVFEDDDWSQLEEYFTPDAIYLPGDGKVIRGRDNIFAHLKESLDSFDRRFDLRRVELVSEPVVTASLVAIQWRALYEKEGLPDISLCGSEEATFEGNAISRLEDTVDDRVADTLQAWIDKYGDKLGLPA
jgi:hypothetical protein